MQQEIRVDMRERTQEEQQEYDRQAELLFRINHTMPRTAEYFLLLKELFGTSIGENSYVAPPLAGAALDKIVIGKNVFINNNFLAMARGGITIEDDVMIAANVQVLTNNHDLYDRQILTCRPVVIKKGAWIGAGATILPGVTIGRYAVVGAASVVTKDVPDYGVAVGNPARVLKILEKDRLEQEGTDNETDIN